MAQALNKILTEEQNKWLENLISSLTDGQKAWISGYLSGIKENDNFIENLFSLDNVLEKPVGSTLQNTSSKELTILYGTHTGNAELIGEKVKALAESQGLTVKLVAMPDYKNKKIKEESNLLVIVSTHGEGEPPVSAEDFYNYLYDKRAPQSLPINYAVIALGDSSYFHYCKTGKDIDERLSYLGARRVHALTELDVDFKDHLGEIIPGIVNVFLYADKKENGNSLPLNPSVSNPDEWVEVEVLEKVLLNGRGSSKETYHIELDIEDTGIIYEPGDALEVKSHNSHALVKDILKELDLTEDLTVEVNGDRVLLHDALVKDYEITVVTLPVLKKYAEIADSKGLNDLLENQEALKEFLYGADFLDLLKSYPAALSPNDLISVLRKLPARLYSISSSYNYNPDEVHITVSAVRYNLNEREHHGVCSGYLADRIHVGENVWIRVKKNEGFRLPDTHDAKVIMIGPGTGIAPFRSFLQERENANAKGENWLFFGDQHFETDFLYQRELLKHRDNGLLHEISVAFSRDQKEKVYVQHQLQKRGEEVYNWLNQGAYVYLCGDKDKMAKDVKKELVQIIEQHGKFSSEKAEEFLKELTLNKRFQEDVY